MEFSQSTIKKFTRCKRQYYYSVVEGLESRTPSLPLKFGNWFHSLLEAHYKGEGWEKRHKKLKKAYMNLTIDEREHYGDLPGDTETMMRAYLYQWRDTEDDWEVLHAEETFIVQHPNLEDAFSFKADLIVRDKSSGAIGIWDHKTTATIPGADFRARDLQSTLYMWALPLATDLEPTYFGFNYIRRKLPKIPKINKNGAISKAKVDAEYYTLAKFLKEYYGESKLIPRDWKVRLKTLRDNSTYFKRSRIQKPEAVTFRLLEEMDTITDAIKAWVEMTEEQPDEDPWVRTMIKSCEWDCDFEALCQTELMGGDGKFLRKTKYQPSKYIGGRTLG